MSTQELARQEPGGVVAQGQQPVSLMSFAMQMAANGTDAANVERILLMLERQEGRERKDRFFEALAKVQKSMPRIRKNGMMDRGQNKGQIAYAKREDIDAVVRPLYEAEGFSVNWDAPRGDGMIRVVGRFTAFGHTEEREWSCSADTSGGKQNPQAAGSTISYGQRYLTKMFWNIIEEGEDTNGAPPAAVENITQAEADTMRSKLEELNANIPVFLKLFDVAKIEDLKQSQVADAWAKIEQKRRKA